MTAHGGIIARREARVADIIVIAGDMSKVGVAALLGPGRWRRIAWVRHACYMVARRAGHSFPAIGSVMNRDHSSVVHGVKAADVLHERDPAFRDFVEELEWRAQNVAPFQPLPREISAGIPDRIAPVKIKPLVCIPRKPTQRCRNDFRSDEQPDSWLEAGDDMIAGSAALAAAVLREKARFQQGEKQ